MAVTAVDETEDPDGVDLLEIDRERENNVTAVGTALARALVQDRGEGVADETESVLGQSRRARRSLRTDPMSNPRPRNQKRSNFSKSPRRCWRRKKRK